MARLSRAAFARLLSLLPTTASAIGILILHQIPSAAELLGIEFLIAGVAIHREASTDNKPPTNGG
jgi:inner membrane transporter RhtA